MKEQGTVAGVFYLTFLFLSAFFGSVFMMGPFLPLMVLHPSLYRQLNDILMAMWLSLPVALLELVHKVKFFSTGDRIRPKEKCVIIMNHRTRLDWMFFWQCLFHQSSLRHEKIILKAGLKNVPGPGWAMQVAGYIFLSRVWEKDEAILEESLDYFHQLQYEHQILLFPEGTDFCKDSKPASDRYAKKNDLEIYKYVLHPRTTGFKYILQNLIKNNMVDAVYDISLGYPDGIPTKGEMDIVHGRFPGEVHFNIRRHPIASLPKTDEDIQNWCIQRWKEKEETLRKFYEEDKQFVDNEKSALGGESPAGDSSLVDSPAVHSDDKQLNTLYLYLAVLYWFVFLLTSTYLLYTYVLARLFFAAVCVFYIIQGLFRGGIDHLIVSRLKSYLHKTKSN
ncbi:lysocardiolipin acyltransferase 1-like [Antedon mediterranea]|uniref:lysocardiolipin acyltransferase 1-like n=1 Tax=Antedon mediterranea TaxID=105859 RepID=UPI003AF84167